MSNRKYEPKKTIEQIVDERTEAKRKAALESEEDLPMGRIENLPHGLGKIQDFVYHGMIYPSRGNAGLAAMSFLQAISSAIFVANVGQGDFALNEMYMQFGPTTSGKECSRVALRKLFSSCTDKLNTLLKPTLFTSLAASQQGLHDELVEANGIGYYMSDEFGEWLADTRREGPRQQCMGYLMQAYTSPFSKVSVPASSARQGKQNEIEFPRINVFATTTWERMTDVMQASQANAGSYNRFFISVGETNYIQKRYDITPLAPSPELKSIIDWIGSHQGGTRITFNDEARAHYRQYDSEVVEPIKFNDPALAGRLSLQALRLAVAIAISDKRLVVIKSDLEAAYEVRMQAYYRLKLAVDKAGLLSGETDDAIAVRQLTGFFEKWAYERRSQLVNRSRAYQKLGVQQRQQVIKMLIDSGVCEESPEPKLKGRLLSLVYET
jgi:hypothetical protein